MIESVKHIDLANFAPPFVSITICLPNDMDNFCEPQIAYNVN